MACRVFLLLICLAVFYFVRSYGQLPQRQARTLSFEVSGFKLPAAMVYIEDNSAPSRVPTISTSKQQVVTFVQNVIMRSVDDVLYQQRREASLSDDLISLISNQFDVTVSYKPLKYEVVFSCPDGVDVVMNMKTNCQIIDGTVVKACITKMMDAARNNMEYCPPANLKDIDQRHLTISRSMTTINIIMANGSTQMWQIVLNRALRGLTSGPLKSQFVSASVTFK